MPAPLPDPLETPPETSTSPSTPKPPLAHPAADDREHCPQCGRVLRSHRCKLVCECGYFMSCSEF